MSRIIGILLLASLFASSLGVCAYTEGIWVDVGVFAAYLALTGLIMLGTWLIVR